jgi:Predicted acetyltransferase
MKTLETERLILRPFIAEDLQGLYDYAKNPKVGPMAGWKPHESIEESREILNMFRLNGRVWAIELKENGKLIGSVGIEENRRRPGIDDCKELGYVLDEAYWGKGLMIEAAEAALEYTFEEEKTAIVAVAHFTFNSQSKRVIEKLGFKYEGTLRRASKLPNGNYADTCMYSMTKREYLLKKAEKAGLFLALPEEFSENAHMEYCQEWNSSEEVIVPFSVRLRDMSYGEWLKSEIKGRTLSPEGFVCGTTYYLTDKSGRIYAVSNLRHELNENLMSTGGHIGYGTRPTERQKGYAGIVLALTLEKCKEKGIEKALVTCNDTNTGSARTIEMNGGVFENAVMSKDNDLVRRYWIEV